MRAPWVIAIACACGGAGGGIPAARFAPRPEWTPEAYRIGAGPAPAVDPARVLTQDEIIDDLAYLQHALDQAWAQGPEQVSYRLDYVAGQLHGLAREPRSIEALCVLMSETVGNTPLWVGRGGEPCRRTGIVVDPPAPPLRAPEPGRNYAWYLAREAEDEPIGVLAVTRFAAPDDPGWQGFDVVLRELRAIDLVLVDLQTAAGDDPRMAFAILAALGLDAQFGIVPQFTTGPYVAVARANRTAAGEFAPRDRALWSSFPTAEAIAGFVRGLGGVTRTAPDQVVFASVLVGSGCERACQLFVEETERHLGHAAIAGWARGRVGHDEYGLVRLPHSGIEVQFPTAWYGGAYNVIGRSGEDARVPADVLASLVAYATVDPIAVAWRRKPLPDCAALPPHPEPRQVIRGCAFDLPAAGASIPVFVTVALDEDVARRFLATCPGLGLGTVLPEPRKRSTLTTAYAPFATLRRLASAPFAVRIEGGCPMSPDDIRSKDEAE